MASSALPLASRRILVVDDQDSIRRLLEVGLTEAGAEVWTAPDGPSALKSLESLRPDLILLDLAMPGMTGWQVLEALAASGHTALIPVVLQTSADDFGSFERARKQGAAAFISKPFRLSEVVETCRRILGGAIPLRGRPETEVELPLVQLRDTDGELLTTGRLLDRSPHGAQVDLDRPLTPGQRVIMTVHVAEGPLECVAEVRWVTQDELRYQHGLAIRE